MTKKNKIAALQAEIDVLKNDLKKATDIYCFKPDLRPHASACECARCSFEKTKNDKTGDLYMF